MLIPTFRRYEPMLGSLLPPLLDVLIHPHPPLSPPAASPSAFLPL
ncbi:hypothetical protein [Streptomyces sp. NPDC050548]